jgi:hypothetical protein
MPKHFVIFAALLLFAPAAPAQTDGPPSKAELAAITERGRLLAEYDAAAWHGTDAVMALKPDEGSVTRYIARKTGEGWTVAFGRLNDARDKFLIAYEASRRPGSEEFVARKYDAPKEDAGFFLHAAKAIDTALADFRGESRPYNVALLQAAAEQFHVYVVPAQTREGVYPLGGDVRYLVSADGSKIVERRQLHKSIIEFATPPAGQKVEAGFHAAVLADVPEDTDVFHVLARRPSVPQWIATRRYVYRVEPDGAVIYVMTTEAFMKIKDKK